MKSLALLLGSLLMLHGAQAQCSAFSQCMNKAYTDAANCNGLVVDTPTLEYYSCVCNSLKPVSGCYFLCSGDENLVRQGHILSRQEPSACQAVRDLPGLGFTSSAASTATSTPTSTVVPSPTVTATSTTAATVNARVPLPTPTVDARGYTGGAKQSAARATTFLDPSILNSGAESVLGRVSVAAVALPLVLLL